MSDSRPKDSQELTLALPDVAASEALGASLGRVLRPGDVVALWGDLGMGKTTLARAAVRAASDDPDMAVPSPTFTLVQIYDALTGPLWHVDLYRLEDPEEALELGLEEAFAEAASLIEWPERLGGDLPADRLDIVLSEDGAGRIARLTAGPSWSDRLEGLRI